MYLYGIFRMGQFWVSWWPVERSWVFWATFPTASDSISHPTHESNVFGKSGCQMLEAFALWVCWNCKWAVQRYLDKIHFPIAVLNLGWIVESCWILEFFAINGNSHDQYSTFQNRTHSSPVEKTCPETGANADLFNDCVYDVCMGAGEVRNGFLLESGQGSLSLDMIYNNIYIYKYMYT